MTILTALLEAGLGSLPLAAVRVDFDKSFIYAAVIFLALMYVLQPLLFEPLLKVFELRDQRTDGAKAEAREMQERAGDLLRKMDRELDRIRRTAAEEREKLRVETARLEAQILEEARESTAAIVAEGRRHIAAEVGALRQHLGARTKEISVDIASVVLGREVR